MRTSVGMSNHDPQQSPPNLGDTPNLSDLSARPLAITIEHFCRLCSVGRTTAWALISAGEVDVVRIRRRTLILMESVDRLLVRAAERRGG